MIPGFRGPLQNNLTKGRILEYSFENEQGYLVRRPLWVTEVLDAAAGRLNGLVGTDGRNDGARYEHQPILHVTNVPYEGSGVLPNTWRWPEPPPPGVLPMPPAPDSSLPGSAAPLLMGEAVIVDAVQLLPEAVWLN